jgi:hypothetical protein
VHIEVRLALDSGKNSTLNQPRIRPQNSRQNSRVIVGLPRHYQFFLRIKNNKPKKPIFAKTAKFI